MKTLKEQRDSPEAVLEKNWSEKFHKKLPQKKLLWSPFFSYVTTCSVTEKEPNHSYFPMTFEKIFRILFYIRTLVKEQKEQKNSPEYILEKRWSESFTKFIRKKLRRSPFLVKWQLATLLKNNFVTVIFLWL